MKENIYKLARRIYGSRSKGPLALGRLAERTQDIEIEISYPVTQNANLNAFIGLYDLGNVETCQNLINMVNELWDKRKEDPTWTDNNKVLFEDPSDNSIPKHVRNDKALYIESSDYNKDLIEMSTWLQTAYDVYIEKFAIEHPMTSYTHKFHQVQAYSSGYAISHYEQHAHEAGRRNIVWTVYLNDITDGSGCTEFPSYGIKLSPKAGQVVLFPAAYTHYHKGNVPYTQKNYATGWFECS